MPFSVLMSLYAKERPEYLRQALDSVYAQTLKPAEVVMVLDGPISEELYAVLADYPQLKIVPLAQNHGLGYALNKGLRHCTHPLVARMDTDDVCFTQRFEEQIRFMEQHPEVDICSSWLEEFEGSLDNVIAVKTLPTSHEQVAKYIKRRSPINHPAVIFRKSAVEMANGYQPFPLFEDYFLWVRMYMAGATFANIPKCLVHFRTSKDMYNRRGGWKYAYNILKFEITLYRIGLISLMEAVGYGLMRSIVSLMPNSIRKMVYSNLLRNRELPPPIEVRLIDWTPNSCLNCHAA